MKKILYTLFTLMLIPCLTPADPLTKNEALKGFRKIISKEQIATELKSTVQKIDNDLTKAGISHVVVISLMKGAAFITTDLTRLMKTPSHLEFIRTQSYGKNGSKRGELTILGLEKLSLKGKDVLVVDDIFDSGVTLSTVVSKLVNLEPRSVRSVILLNKKIDRPVTYTPDYTVFHVGNPFVVGYGMDYKEHWRHLPDIYEIPQ